MWTHVRADCLHGGELLEFNDMPGKMLMMAAQCQTQLIVEIASDVPAFTSPCLDICELLGHDSRIEISQALRFA